MERYRFLALSLPLVAAVASAQAPFSLQTESARLMGFIFDYYLTHSRGASSSSSSSISVLNRILKRRFGVIDFVATVFGIILALILVA